jgi:CRP/FNR family transcriptional regulator
VLVASNYPPNNLIRLPPDLAATAKICDQPPRTEVWVDHPPVPVEHRESGVAAHFPASAMLEPEVNRVVSKGSPEEIDPLYLFACQVEWEQRSVPSAAWEVIAGARSSNADTRAHSLSLLEHSDQPRPKVSDANGAEQEKRHRFTKEASMRTPYVLDIIESCVGCKASRDGFFCRFSPTVLRSVDIASYHRVMPSGTPLFSEGQMPRGIYVLCSGKVKLSTTSKDGKVLILKHAEAGEVLGLSAAISGTNFQMSAETSSPCQLNFIGRQDLMTLLQDESEVGVHAALSLSREFQATYRNIHGLVLARSAYAKLARLMLSCASLTGHQTDDRRPGFVMTHQEMAQRIGSSRETVTRILTNLKKKRFIQREGTILVICDRTGLEALAV